MRRRFRSAHTACGRGSQDRAFHTQHDRHELPPQVERVITVPPTHRGPRTLAEAQQRLAATERSRRR